MDKEQNITKELVLWWQYEKGGTVRGLAKALGTAPATIYDWQSEPGGAIPLRWMKRVGEVSGGLFNLEDLYPEAAKQLSGSGG